ncbi:MAG: preprotein translocase subunit YajC [Gemmatimonadaceae bacterium]
MTHSYTNLLLMQLPGNTMLGPIFMYGAIFAVFYFILIRPQQKQRKVHDALMRAVKRGDEIVTTGGIVGEIIHIRDSSADGGTSVPMEDRITIKSGESRLVIERGRIARVIRSSGGQAEG